MRQRIVAIPGVVDGDALGDVLLESSYTLMHAATPSLRLITYNMELNAGILLAEMERCEAAAWEEVLETTGAFQASLSTLRRSRSHPELVTAASRLLGCWCPPKKRCRVKTHPVLFFILYCLVLQEYERHTLR